MSRSCVCVFLSLVLNSDLLYAAWVRQQERSLISQQIVSSIAVGARNQLFETFLGAEGHFLLGESNEQIRFAVRLMSNLSPVKRDPFHAENGHHFLRVLFIRGEGDSEEMILNHSTSTFPRSDAQYYYVRRSGMGSDEEHLFVDSGTTIQVGMYYRPYGYAHIEFDVKHFKGVGVEEGSVEVFHKYRTSSDDKDLSGWVRPESGQQRHGQLLDRLYPTRQDVETLWTSLVPRLHGEAVAGEFGFVTELAELFPLLQGLDPACEKTPALIRYLDQHEGIDEKLSAAKAVVGFLQILQAC